MTEFAEDIKFFEEGGKHFFKRLNAEGGTISVSAGFDSLEAAQNEARGGVEDVDPLETNEDGAPGKDADEVGGSGSDDVLEEEKLPEQE